MKSNNKKIEIAGIITNVLSKLTVGGVIIISFCAVLTTISALIWDNLEKKTVINFKRR